jgi:hypothetical protein
MMQLSAFIRLTGLVLLLLLAGCQSSRISGVAASAQVVNVSNGQVSNHDYQSEIYLDVAIPVFNPGLPADLDKLKKMNIWPQLRRAEANRFAMMSKNALAKTGAFGNISVLPDTESVADLYVLGRIDHSDSEAIQLTIEVVDISGRSWDKKTFIHRVAADFHQHKENQGKDAYQPVFDAIGDFVYQLLVKKTEQQKTTLQHISHIRFAQSLSPEAFSSHLATDEQGIIQLKSLPSDQNPMIVRVEPLRVQQQLFIDRLQTQYQGFNQKTDEGYHLWQKETLPAMAAARESENSAMLKGVAGGAILLVAALSGVDNLLSIGTQVAAVGGLYLLKGALKDNAEADVHLATIDEMGESIDIEMDQQVVSLQGKTLELSGNAQEQYNQYKAHLKRIFERGNTPQKQL